MYSQTKVLHPAAAQTADSATVSRDSWWAAVLFGTSLALFVLTLAVANMVEGRWAFLVAVMTTLAMDGVIWFGVIKNDHRCFALKFAFVAFAMAKLFPIGACLSLGLDEDYLFPGGAYLMGAPLTAAFAGNIRNFSIAVIFLITRPFSRPHGYDITIRKMFWNTSPRFELFLIFAGVVNLLYWVAVTGLDNPLFYFIRILEKGLTAVPFFVGFTAFKYKKAFRFWLLVLAVQLVISFLTGTRGAAFVPIGFFLVGLLLGLPNWKSRLRWGIGVVLPAAILLAVAGAYIGSVRSVVGRTDLKAILTEGTMMDRASESYVAAQVVYRGNAAFEAFRRLTLWPDYVVPAMTPEPIPFRGFEDFGYEVRSAFGLGIFALINPNWRGSFYFGNIFLQQYGFAVHVDASGRKTSNVELPIQVDGFMRGGWMVALGFTMVGCMVLFLVERLLRHRLLPNLQPVFLLLLMFLCYIAFSRFRSASLVDCMRQLILEGGFSFIAFYGFDRALKMLGKTDPPR